MPAEADFPLLLEGCGCCARTPPPNRGAYVFLTREENGFPLLMGLDALEDAGHFDVGGLGEHVDGGGAD